MTWDMLPPPPQDSTLCLRSAMTLTISSLFYTQSSRTEGCLSRARLLSGDLHPLTKPSLLWGPFFPCHQACRESKKGQEPLQPGLHPRRELRHRNGIFPAPIDKATELQPQLRVVPALQELPGVGLLPLSSPGEHFRLLRLEVGCALQPRVGGRGR